jgi:NitT/TauT family transport system permease protein
MSRVRAAVPTLALFAALLLAWQAAGPVFGIRAYLLPVPFSVLRAALDFSIPWYAHIWITTLEILGGFAVAGVIGVLLGMAVAWSPAIARALVP